MDTLVIEGGKKLKGTITVGGAKNAALPLLFASVLTSEKCFYENVPDLLDITTTIKLLKEMGIETIYSPESHTAQIQAKTLTSYEASYDLVRTMRASVLILGPTLARFGKSKVSLPGGCSIGARPVNLHLLGFEKMGARIEIQGGYIHAEIPSHLNGRLNGADITFDQVSVGATENIMMAATLARGKTILRNAAREPEIVDLAKFLNSCGAKITGAGESEIIIEGVETMQGTTHRIIPDRIEAGTYLIAAAITGGEVRLPGVPESFLKAVLEKLSQCGFAIQANENEISLVTPSNMKKFNAVDIVTHPFPGFPTDMQAQVMTLMCVAEGTSVITETIFENRFMHVPELMRLGADIKIQGNACIVKGHGSFEQANLTGATVMATDLRASACLVLAGLVAKGLTKVRRIYHLDRGYEKMEKKLQSIGANMWREKEE